jgi:hypothetical protein
MSAQNPQRCAWHNSADWIERVAASIRDLNPDYHDFEAEVAAKIRAAVPPPEAQGSRLTADDYEQIAEAIEEFIMNGDPEVDAGWQSYFDKLRAHLESQAPANHPLADLETSLPADAATVLRDHAWELYWDGTASAEGRALSAAPAETQRRRVLTAIRNAKSAISPDEVERLAEELGSERGKAEAAPPRATGQWPIEHAGHSHGSEGEASNQDDAWDRSKASEELSLHPSSPASSPHDQPEEPRS